MRAIRGEAGAGRDRGTVDMGELLYRRTGQHSITEAAPAACPAGHPLTAGTVLVGWDGVGRTYTCWPCYQAGTLPHTMRYRCWTAASGATSRM